MIYFKADDFWNYICKTFKWFNPTHVYISTYNIRTSIINYNDRFGKPIPGLPSKMNNSQKIVNYLNQCNSYIIIGEDNGYNRESKRIKSIWPNVKVYLKKEHHAKAVVMKFSDKRIEAWVGSVNLSDSRWSDIMVKLESKEDIKSLLVNMSEWKKQSQRLK